VNNTAPTGLIGAGSRQEVRMTVHADDSPERSVSARPARLGHRTGGSKLLAAIVGSSDDAILSMTLDGVVTSWNQAAERIYGYQAAEIIGRCASLLMPPDRPDEMAETLDRIRAGERVDHYETTRRRKDGATIAISLTVSPVHDATGGIVGASSIAHVVTESDRGTAQARTSGGVDPERHMREFSETKAFLDNILQSSTKYSIIGMDLDRRILSWNNGASRNYGYTTQEVIGQDAKILHTSQDAESGAVKRLWTTAYEDGLAEGTFERVRKDGSRFTASVVVTRRDDTLGHPVGFLLMSHDISEKILAEEKLRSTAMYSRSLIEASLDPLVTISPEGKITDVNEAAIRVTGVERAQLVGTDFSDYFTEPDRAREGYRQTFAQGFVTNYPLTIRHAGGGLTSVLYNASVYNDEAGNVLGAFAAARDVTAQRRAESEIAQQRARELERLAELERFQKLTVGRELRMIELKKEIEDLRAAAGGK
jgi:PAS domain S-box-containing protein